MKKLALIALLFMPNFASAAKGYVVFSKLSCDYYIVESATGYVLLQWFGGVQPNEGDYVVGDFESYGMKDIFNVSLDSETNVWVEDFWLSKDDVIERYYEQCG